MSDDTKSASELQQADHSDELSVVEGLSGEEEVEYEYVYEDEEGNPIAAPDGHFNPEQFEEEVIEVVEEFGEEDAQRQSTNPTSATVNLPPDKQETRRIRSGSTRRLSDRRAGKRSSRNSRRSSSREMDPAQIKYARLKTILMVGSLALIPILIIAILLTYAYKQGWWPFSPHEARKVVVQSDYERGRDMAAKAWRAFDRARKTMANKGKDNEYYSVLQQCEGNYNRAIELMQGWRDRNKGKGYWYVDRRIQDANIKLREIREQKFKIEMRRGRSR